MAGPPWSTVYVGIAAYTITRSTVGMFFLLSFVATVAKIVYKLTLYPAYFSSVGHIPSPSRRSWLTGNSKSFFIESPFEEMREWITSIPNNGLIRYYIAGNLERVLLTSPKSLSELLAHKVYEFPKPDIIRASLARVTGEHGLLLVEGDEHKQQRKNLMPAFAYRHIKEIYPIFWTKSAEMVKCIEDDLKNRADPTDNIVCIGTWASRATLDIIGVAGMDHDFDALRNPNNELQRQYQTIMSDPPLGMKVLYVFAMMMGNPGWVTKLPLKRNEDIMNASEVIRSVARQMIREKHQKLNTDTTGVDILSVALQSGSFTEDELIDQMMTFLGAGHETTSTALQWAIYALCKHPDVQARLRDEVRSNLPSISTDHPAPLSATTLDALPYLSAVCNEILRFHPSVPSTVRIASRDTTLVNTPIPKGTLFLIAAAVINHNKELWGPDADQFNPERWLGPGRANTGGAANNYAYLTFLHGPRSCIGQGFAKAELACLVASLVGRFEMVLAHPEKKLEVRQSATVCPKDGVLVKMNVLEGW
ncbi:cytochrome P450 [Aspergillus steynii IBT 23096]|uniref:Cytochrome P450 n=1 Tax=Aspergillus steynii IBT 23096 TaxID=1392250 RepID=A0A2I2GRR4_9EURO|nr:cytochrome P450 [Aspergillus steynii IBT 23096]PLB55569.1 cytochrome P450 [Aspergillus steynii IBT 23096]